MFLIQLITASATTCPLVIDTYRAFKPVHAKVIYDAPAGWRRGVIAALPRSRAAQIEMYKSAFKDYSLPTQDAILREELPEHSDEVALKLVWGEPDWFWQTTPDCRALLYVESDRHALVETCAGEIDSIQPLIRGIECDDLTASVALIQRNKKAFAALSLEQQLDVIGDVRAEWMDDTALALTFGRRNTLAKGNGPIREPSTTPTPSAESSHQIEPSTDPRPAVVEAPTNEGVLPRSETRSRGEWSFELACGTTDYVVELGIGAGYSVSATSRPIDGKIVQNRTYGRVVDSDGSLQLLGFGAATVGTKDDLKVVMGPWPVASCEGKQITL